MNEYKIVKITDLGTVNRGKSKHRPRNDSILYGGEYPFIQTGDVKKANLHLVDYTQTYNDVGLKQSKLWKKGTLCFTIAANIADSAILGMDACFPDSIVGFLPYENVSDTTYVKYLFDELKLYFQQISKGTTQDNLSLDKICRVKLRVPDYDTQVKVASILSTYDNLIENNNKRIRLLEQMAENLYKEWFVRFRFPGYEDVEFIDGFPKKWKICRMDQLAKIKAGGDAPADSTKELTDECSIPIYSNGIENEGLYGYTSKAKISKPSITISARGTVGYTCLRRVHYTPIVRLICIIPHEEKLANWLYYYFKRTIVIANGTSQQQITIPMMSREKVLFPTEDLINKFYDYSTAYLDEMDRLKEQNSNLKKQRDMLLPRLMSGKLEV